MSFKKIMLLLSTVLLLQGCVPIIIGGTVAATYLIVHSTRTTKAQRADQQLQKNIKQRLNRALPIKKQCHIVVSAFQNTVLLVGQCPSGTLKRQAQQITAATPQINRFYNEINIDAPNSSLNRASDDWISTKIRLDLHHQKSLASADYQIITENSVVFIMGSMTKAQAKTLVRVVRNVSGVEKVVKVFTVHKASKK